MLYFRRTHFSTIFERVLVKKTQNEFSTFWLHLPPVEFSPPLSVWQSWALWPHGQVVSIHCGILAMRVFIFQLFHLFLSISRQCGRVLSLIYTFCLPLPLPVCGILSRYFNILLFIVYKLKTRFCLKNILYIRITIRQKFSWLYMPHFRVTFLALWFVWF